MRQHWQQSQQDTSAEEFTLNWNFLCKLQGPAKSRNNHINDVDQNLDDVEDFMENEPHIKNHHFEVLGQGKFLQRKRVSPCRHKLQGRAYPKIKKTKTILRQPEQLLEPEDLELDHEWLQLIQMEKAIEEKKNQLQGTEAQNHWDLDEDHETFWEDDESFTERNDHLDDGDLEYINVILNSFSRDQGTHQNSNNSRLESFTQEDALARAFVSQKMPKTFNSKFNQNSTTRSSEEKHFSYFSNVEEDGTSELGDYFSDDEEDDTWDREKLTS